MTSNGAITAGVFLAAVVVFGLPLLAFCAWRRSGARTTKHGHRSTARGRGVGGATAPGSYPRPQVRNVAAYAPQRVEPEPVDPAEWEGWPAA